MSKKTEAIYRSLENLSQLKEQLESYNSQAKDRVLEDISFKMNQELSTLKFWIDSLYTFNGKARTIAKKESSRQNGKKGGRPPKQISDARKRIEQLVNVVIPQLEHDIKFAEEEQKENSLRQQLSDCQKELSELKKKVDDYRKTKL